MNARRTFDHSGWWFLILHCNDTAVMKSWNYGVSPRDLSRFWRIAGSALPMPWRTS